MRRLKYPTAILCIQYGCVVNFYVMVVPGCMLVVSQLLSSHVDRHRVTMAKLFVALTALLATSACAFVPQTVGTTKTALSASSDEIWDPMGLYNLGSGEAFDTFPGMFPDKQYLQASEIKHGRMCMLAWTGVWATTKVSDENHLC